jgi:hypothetical protein
LHYIQVLCQPGLWKADHAYFTYLKLKKQPSHLHDRKLERLYIFYVWLRLTLCYEHDHSHDFVLLLHVACTIFYIIVYIRKVESHVQIADRYATWKISSGAENLVFQALQL